MITVHHLGSSQSERIPWLCEELGIPYTLKRYDRDPVTRLAPPEYRALHPMGIAPVITDGEAVLPESGAIVEYVITKYGKGRLAIGPDQPNYRDYLFWLHFANGTMMPTEFTATILWNMLELSDLHPARRMLMDRGERAIRLVEQRLGETPFFAGSELTAADIMMHFCVSPTIQEWSRRDLSGLPNIRAYGKRIGERPAYRRAMAKGEPDRRN